MSRKLKDMYIPKLYMTRLLLKWMDLKQGKRKVSEYIEDFEEYRMRCKFVDSPQVQIAFFVHGLRPDLGARVLEQNPPTADLAYSLVEGNELSHDDIVPPTTAAPRATQTTTTTSSAARSSSSWNQGSTTVHRPTAPTPTPVLTLAPPTPSAISTARGPNAPQEPIQCFKCKGFGHRWTDCPTLLVMDIHGNPLGEQLEDDLEVDKYSAECLEDEDLDDPLGYIQITPIIPPSTLPVATLGIQQETTEMRGPSETTRAAPTPTTATVPTRPIDVAQRTSIFYTHVKIGGRTYKLTVNSGSCINGISEDTATRLGLPRTPHPTPYNVSWIDASTIPVKMQCYVPLKMSMYDEKVLCDVLPMKIGSIILGRPWFYDHDVQLAANANTCPFIYGGRRLIWYPLVRLPSLPTQSSTTLSRTPPPTIVTNGFIIRRELEQDRELTPVCYAMTLSDGVTDSSHENPTPDITQLLEEYADVFPAELPNELPPLRNIQHAIDLVLGATLPNLPHYQMDPIKYDELYSQVKDLLAKGLIRESLSPCVVPALLAPEKDGFILSSHGVAADPAKIDAITTWPKLKSIHDARSFVALATFYQRFIPGFSGVTTPIMDILKNDKFEWTPSADKAFELLKKLMTEAPVLKLSDFNKVFEVACDASGIGIGGVLSQDGHPIEYFNEKLNKTRKRYDNYDGEFYALVQSL
ncbi:uncharacterized protein LOC144705461 [Wolffia australiana]